MQIRLVRAIFVDQFVGATPRTLTSWSISSVTPWPSPRCWGYGAFACHNERGDDPDADSKGDDRNSDAHGKTFPFTHVTMNRAGKAEVTAFTYLPDKTLGNRNIALVF